jgi:hypothetical protein
MDGDGHQYGIWLSIVKYTTAKTTRLYEQDDKDRFVTVAGVVVAVGLV